MTGILRKRKRMKPIRTIKSFIGKVCPACHKNNTVFVTDKYYIFTCSCGWKGDARTMKTEREIKEMVIYEEERP